MEKLQKIIKGLKKVLKEEGMTAIKPDCVLENAVSIYLTDVIGERKGDINSDKPSFKQLPILRDMEKKGLIKDIDKITRLEASQIIKNYLEKKPNKETEY